VLDFFKAHNYDALNAADVDLGSGGAVAIPGTPYIVGGGKQGLLYLVNTNNMGKFNSTSDQVVQEFQADNGLWGSPVFWNNPSAPTLYLWGVNDSLKAFRYNVTTGKFNTPFAAASSVKTPSGFDPCGALSVSSNQSVAGTGILWATIPLADPDHATVHGRLYAFDATNVSKELWDSGQDAARDDFGNFAKFVPPTVVNGKVYVATDSHQVCAYGLINATANFKVGDHVTITTTSPLGVNIRNASGTIIGQQPTRTSGIVAAGPFVVPGSGPSWEVSFATGPSGWVREPYLILSTTPKFTLGEQVVTTTTSPLGVNIRSTPAGTIIGQQPTGANGTVVSGPVVGLDGTTYWQVNFTTAPSGWVKEPYLTP
jgi:hypothetical protein